MFQLDNVQVKNVFTIKSLLLKEPVISIEGQSGSGKSTLLRLLNNLDDPAAGIIKLNSRNITELPACELRRKVVMAPQNPVMFDGSIRENLYMGLRLSGQQAASDEALKEMLDRLRLEKSLDININELSGGEKQRIALGRVLLMKQANVLLLDEPTSELDNKMTDHVLSQFLTIARKHEQQVIMVTHDKHVSEKFADNVINMDTYSGQHGGE